MDRSGDAEFEGAQFDPDAVLWVRGVDYVTGWREATQAVGELGDALTAAGVGEAGVKLRASATTDGSGVVRLELSPAAAREVAKLARVAAARWRKAG
ncbi:hypothetical protein [Streptomyces gilvosporeus]|uniref:Uncharacterized protein n=1 Tax=Streptomyces gilvosporeus TaxID=553510 RepID=A0A1V0TTX0_9ACTN|nr:hypothetical protein [Streptomyces gilvosporeus]ARF56341.1 hypothetical protein B1H19_21105 [Streptomyces gilvosporeus]